MMMVLNQKVIKKVHATYVWKHGNTKLELREMPCYNLNIITKDSVKCYAIDKKEYDRFVRQWQNYHDIDWNSRKAREAIEKYYNTESLQLKQFYLDVFKHYNKRLKEF